MTAKLSDQISQIELEQGLRGISAYCDSPGGVPERRFSFSSLRTRLMLLVLLAVLPAFALVIHNGMDARLHGAQSAKTEAMRVAQLSAIELKQLIDAARQLLISVAQHREVRKNDLGYCSSLFTNLMKQYPQYAQFGVADMDGNVFCSSAPTSTDSVNVADHAYFWRTLTTRDFSIGNYQKDRVTQKATLNFGYPVFNDSGQIQSVLFVALDLLGLNRFAAEGRFHNGERLTVRDGNGTILVRYPDSEKWVGLTDPETPILKVILSQRSEGTAEAAGIDGITCLYAFTPLSDAFKGGVYLSVGIPASLAYADANRQLRVSLFYLAVVALVVVVVAWFAGDFFVLRQVRALISATKRLAVGDLSGRSGMAHGRGELGYLAYVFDTMADYLEQSVKELHRARAEYLALIEEIPAVTYSAAVADSLRVLYISPQVENMTGFSVAEWISDHDLWEKLLHPEDRSRVLACASGCHSTGEAYGIEYRLVRRDGSIVWVRDEAKVIRNDAQTVFIQGIIRDVDGRKLAEEALRRSEDMYRTVFENTGTAAAIIEEDMTLSRVNMEFEKLSGFSRAEVENLKFLPDFVSNDDVKRITNYHRQRRIDPSSAPRNYEFQFIDRKGSLKNILMTVALIPEANRSIASLLDITDWKLADRALRESEERLRAQYQSIPVPTFTWRREGADLVLADYNRASQTISRGRLAQHLGRTAADIYRNTPGILADMNRCLDDRVTFKKEILSYRSRPESEEKDFVVTYAYVPPDLVMVHREDITERRRLEKMVLMREKMASLGNVTAGIAHEIRNPLSGINIHLHTLDKICSSGGYMDEVEVVIGELKSASGKIENVIKRVLNFAKPGQPRLDLVDINKHIEEAIKLAALIIEKNLVVLETSLAEDLPNCLADPYLLEQVILNLINNAAEAMRDYKEPKRIEVVSREKDERIQIVVSDSGPGVPFKLRPRIFDPFFTTKKEGSGIGLSICQRIITDHSGSLFLSTSKWGGAQFVIEIPTDKRARKA